MFVISFDHRIKHRIAQEKTSPQEEEVAHYFAAGHFAQAHPSQADRVEGTARCRRCPDYPDCIRCAAFPLFEK